ncbi:MAG: hypothetical protein WDN04_03005 [Rhodospirillales bacterium]
MPAATAGVVDQHVNVAGGRGYRIGAFVRGKVADRDGGRAEIGCDRLGACAVASMHDDGTALSRQHSSDTAANTRTAPGHQSPPTPKPKIHDYVHYI